MKGSSYCSAGLLHWPEGNSLSSLQPCVDHVGSAWNRNNDNLLIRSCKTLGPKQLLAQIGTTKLGDEAPLAGVHLKLRAFREHVMSQGLRYRQPNPTQHFKRWHVSLPKPIPCGSQCISRVLFQISLPGWIGQKQVTKLCYLALKHQSQE